MKYEIDKSMQQGANGHLDKAQEDWLRLMPDGLDGTPFLGATDVLRAIDQLRRDLSGYHGQLKAHDDLQRHCDNQRRRIGELEGLYAKAKAENVELRELVRDMYAVMVEDAANCDVTYPEQFDDRMRELGVEI